MEAKLWREEGVLSEFEDSRVVNMLGVVLYYRTTLDSRERIEWGGKFGMASHICDVFNIP